jgi:hypothetical protein
LTVHAENVNLRNSNGISNCGYLALCSGLIAKSGIDFANLLFSTYRVAGTGFPAWIPILRLFIKKRFLVEKQMGCQLRAAGAAKGRNPLYINRLPAFFKKGI